MQPHTHHVFDECHDDLQPRSVQAAPTIALTTFILLDYRTIEHYETESTRYSYNRGRRAMPKTIGASPTTTAERNIAKIAKFLLNLPNLPNIAEAPKKRKHS
jgi:hypothetical protein